MPSARKTPAGASRRASAPATPASPGTEEPFGRLSRIAVRGLLGQFSHQIDLPADAPAILTGANGTGKSTILRLVNAVGAGDWLTLARLPVERASLRFEGGSKVEISSGDGRLRVAEGDGKVTLDLRELLEGDPSPRRLATMAPAERRRYLAQREAYRYRVMDPSLQGLPPAERARRQREALHFEQLRLLDDADAEILQRIAERFRVRFITDQRLIIRGEERDPRVRRELPAEPGSREPVSHAVTHYSADLGGRMTWALRQYANASQQEDREFPQRVARELMRNRPVDLDELVPLMEDVANKRVALERVGLAESFAEPSFDSQNLGDPNVRIVFKTFAEATLRKFETIENFRAQLELFTSFLNRRFIGKSAVTRADAGLMFVLPDGSELEPAQLSSGEQQMLVLAYEVLFETPEGTLLLIDEPEISLHVLWQSTFVDDIAEMGRPRDLSFLLATHSPTLIGGRRDLMRSLDQG